MSDTTTGTPNLDPGVYLVNAACPRCGVIEEVLVRIGVVLTTPDDDLGSLRVRVKGKAREHDCRQQRLTALLPAPEVLADHQDDQDEEEEA